MDKRKIIEYSDELNDEFAGDNIVTRKIGADYIYVYNSVWKKFTRFFWYRLVAFLPAMLYLKIKFHHKIVNRKVISSVKKTGYYAFANHTHNICDALIPTFVNFPRNVFVVVHPNNISMPVLGKITPSLGAIPLPDDRDSTKNFMDCLNVRIKQKNCLTIYPEAHIWPFYTKIRPFSSNSFRFPVSQNVPVICFTNTYQKQKFSKNPKIVTYVDGPFYPDSSLSAKEQREDLRNRVYEAMCGRSKNNTVELIKYVKKEVN